MDFSSSSFDYCHNNILQLFQTACESSKMVAEVFPVRYFRPLLFRWQMFVGDLHKN